MYGDHLTTTRPWSSLPLYCVLCVVYVYLNWPSTITSPSIQKNNFNPLVGMKLSIFVSADWRTFFFRVVIFIEQLSVEQRGCRQW